MSSAMAMKCHYEVLGVSKEANDEEIKKSYRKLALQWHPDKNRDREDECTAQFRLIQQAYEVLSDPQERAWYDKHRDAILRGGLGHGDKYNDNSLDVYQYFNSSCYCGFSDDNKGFYATYSEVFRKISLEDQEYMDSVNTVPEFGNSTSVYEEIVGPFYAHWESYCTAKSYVWVEQYDTREAPNRQIRRLMEQDNKKLRDKARRERNEEVRALVAYVRKRDPRVQVYKQKLEERAAEISRLAEERKKRDRQQRLKNLENYRESTWSSMSALECQLKQLELNVAEQFGDLSDSDLSEGLPDECSDTDAPGDVAADNVADDDDGYDPLYCIACNKAFKSDKAMQNHNKSRKHLDNVYQLQCELAEDDELMNELHKDDDDDSEAVTDVTPASTNESRAKSKKQKKKRRQQMKLQEANNEDIDDEDEESVTPCDPVAERSTEGDVSNPASENHNDLPQVEAAAGAVENGISDSQEDKPSSSSSSKSKNNKKSSAAASKAETCSETSSRAPLDSPLNCNTCNAKFKSRNKLFEHIKTTGHALRIDCNVDSTAVSETRNSKGKKTSRKK